MVNSIKWFQMRGSVIQNQEATLQSILEHCPTWRFSVVRSCWSETRVSLACACTSGWSVLLCPVWCEAGGRGQPGRQVLRFWGEAGEARYYNTQLNSVPWRAKRTWHLNLGKCKCAAMTLWGRQWYWGQSFHNVVFCFSIRNTFRSISLIHDF